MNVGDDSNPDINHQGERIQELLQRIETLSYPGAKELMQECVEALLAFYGHGLSRILKVVREANPEDKKIYPALINDDVIKGLLLIHDLHPSGLETRLRDALDKVRPYLKSHGGDVELISLQKDVARLRLLGTCESCASSAVTLELAIRHAIEQACPDLVHFEVEGPAQNGAVKSKLEPAAVTDWVVIESAQILGEGEWLPVRLGDIRVVICRVNQTFYAYRNRCPACNLPFDAGTLDSGFLSCSRAHRYDLLHAGRSPEISSAHLDPFPLLTEDGTVKVAVTRKRI